MKYDENKMTDDEKKLLQAIREQAPKLVAWAQDIVDDGYFYHSPYVVIDMRDYDITSSFVSNLENFCSDIGIYAHRYYDSYDFFNIYISAPRVNREINHEGNLMIAKKWAELLTEKGFNCEPYCRID